MDLEHYIDIAAKIIEAIGITIILVGAITALFKYGIAAIKGKEDCYFELRRNLGKVILLGLEILIAADIMATVITEPDLESVLILGLIVVIRIILSLSIQVEIEGKFPWNKKSNDALHKAVKKESVR
ncbi:DUF1622 domain-containing protein [Dokdonia sinensis]|uniref:DUF1622 domain-containing protein n=1 Tax=Dokdonia sinensis TaxID=2479847 RepID=A0A3M0GML2_9FLAO|nr:DUF1622 domain-containing protein [Dokdonia sinensis]RMB62863.1 DUF1622 domain-containing protein [Dokdonia sinensis]